MSPRLWRAESGQLRPVHGGDPGWRLALPAGAGPADTPGGRRWLGPIVPDGSLWLEAPDDPRSPPLAEGLALFLRSDREAVFLSSELAARYQEIDLLYTISEVLGHTVRLGEAAEIIVRAVSDVVGAERASIAVYDQEAGILRTVAARGFDAGRADDVHIDDPDSIAAAVVRESRPMVGLAESDGGSGRGYRGEAYMSLPICFRGEEGASRCVGVINLTDRRQGGRFTAADQKLVSAAANQIGAAIELSRLVVQEREQQRIHDELELAYRLQASLLPNPAVLYGVARAAVRCVPAEQVGGDFYTFNRFGRLGVGVLLGDVSSHGYSAALMMAVVMAAAGVHVAGRGPPHAALEALRDELAEKLASSDTYLTVFYGILDPGPGTLSWASAGHPYAFRLPRHGPPERLDATAPPLGLAGKSEIDLRSINWDRDGDTLCLWTDGIVDSTNAAGERFGEGRLLAALERRREESPEQIVDGVMAEVEAFAPRAGDDRTLLVLRL